MPGGRRQGRGRAKRPSRSERHQRARAAGVNAAVARAEGAIEITLPARRVQPESVVAHLGPTNSGKTYHALEVLKERGRGVYAGPLRMLAQEAHRRLSAELGEDAVGLVTGEERINDSAPIICCTVEMAPSSGEVLVLDEVQWADDPERGSAWTRLLLAGDYRHILVLGALDAEPLVLNAFPEAEVKVFERILPLEFVGERSLRGLTPGTVVVAFSRKAVLALAGEINRLHPDRVSVLYGAMPLSSRREEIDRFLSGRSDVTVATDVLGHGVNLPCETLLFAETTKFDGESRRDLLPWELAQIAGRAGRFGLVERGHVGVLTGMPWANADPEIVEEALQPHVVLPSGHLGYRIVDEARIRPRLADLGVDDPRRLDAALAAWHRVATRAWAHEGWLAVESLSPIRGRLAAIQRRLADRNRRLSIEDTWKLINAPVDEDNAELLATLALALARRHGPAVAAHLPARPGPAARLDARGSRASWKNRKHPALVRAPVSGRRRRHDRAGRRARGDRRRTGRRAPAPRGERPHDRPLPHVRQDDARRGSRSATAASAAAEIRDTGGMKKINLDELEIAYDDDDPEATGSGTTASGRRSAPRRWGPPSTSCRRGRASARTTTSTAARSGRSCSAAGRRCGTRTARTCSSRATSSASRKGPSGAHKLTNNAPETVRVMLLSDKPSLAAAVYPDSGKIGIFPPDESDKIMVRRESAVDYFDGELLERPRAGSAAPRRSSSRRRRTRSCSG